MEQISFYVDKKVVYVNVTRTNNKNMYLKVNNEKGIFVLAPKHIKLSEIECFVQKHITNFLSHQKVIKKNVLFSLEEKYLYFFGQKYSFQVLSGFSFLTYKFINNTFYFHTKNGAQQEIDAILKKLLKKELEKYVVKTQRKWEKVLKCPKHSTSFSYKNSNWGSNNINLQKITYSTKLAHYKIIIIDYLIVHELAHYFEPNHSLKFWTIVAKHVPNYKKMRTYLKNISENK